MNQYVQESRLAMARYVLKAAHALAVHAYDTRSFCEAAKWYRRVLDVHSFCLKWYSGTGGWAEAEREANATVGAAERRSRIFHHSSFIIHI